MNNSGKKRFGVYMFEPTNYCNLDCPLCPTGNRLNRRTKGFIDPKIFEKVLDIEQIMDRKICLWGWGEPLLHPKLSSLITVSKNRKNTVEIQSNGTAPYEAYRQLVAEGLDILTISLDGMSDESIQPLRGKRTSAEIIKEKISRLADLCRSLGSETSINVQCIATRFNEVEIEEVRNWVLNVAGASKFVLKTLCIGEITREKAKHYLPKDPDLTRYTINNDRMPSMPVRLGHTCSFLSNVRVTLWDFTVVPCCYDYAGEYAFGNILSECEEEEFMRKYDRKEVHMCKICPEMRTKDIFVGE